MVFLQSNNPCLIPLPSVIHMASIEHFLNTCNSVAPLFYQMHPMKLQIWIHDLPLHFVPIEGNSTNCTNSKMEDLFLGSDLGSGPNCFLLWNLLGWSVFICFLPVVMFLVLSMSSRLPLQMPSLDYSADCHHLLFSVKESHTFDVLHFQAELRILFQSSYQS